MSSNKKKPPSTQKTLDWKKDDEVTQGVVVADSFDWHFSPVSRELPRCLLPLAGGRPLIDYVLEWLIEEGISEIIVFCCAHGERVRKHVSDHWQTAFPALTIHCVMSSTEDCISIGDAIREIDREGLIRSDFVLISGDLVSNVKLANIIQAHKTKRRKEKTLVMTQLYQRLPPRSSIRCHEDDAILSIDPETSRLLHSQPVASKDFSLPVNHISTRKEVHIRYDLSSCGIFICSPQVAPLFTDNFDYQTVPDFTKGILTNEEILGDQIHVHVVEEGYATAVSNLFLYNKVNMDLLKRRIYPVVPDISAYLQKRHNIYVDKTARLARDQVIEECSLVSRGSMIGDGTRISQSVIGANCTIGQNVKIENSYIWDNVIIEDNCDINSSLICNDCHILRETSISLSSVSFKVRLGPSISLTAGHRISLKKPPRLLSQSVEDMSLESTAGYDKELVGQDGCGYHWPINEEEEGVNLANLMCAYSQDDDDDEDEDDESDVETVDIPPSPPTEMTSVNQFHMEVVENLRYGLTENIAADNIALEINASKFKFNIEIPDLCSTFTKALMDISISDEDHGRAEMTAYFQTILDFLRPLLIKYLNTVEYQMFAVIALEQYFILREQLAGFLPTVLHKLYDSDVIDETVILSWHSRAPVEGNTLRDNPKMVQLVTWLRDAEEESDDDNDDEEDSD